MIITIKNLQQQTFTVEFEPGKTVVQLKQQIFEERGPEYMVEKQKLIYAGVILDDTRTVASYNIDEKKFVVVMLKRDLGGYEARSTSAATGATKPPPPTTVTEDIKQETTLTKKAAASNTTNKESSDGSSSDNSKNDVNLSTSSEISSSNTVGGTDTNLTVNINAESSLLMGDEYNRSVNSIIEMGYSREMVVRAMAASFNNPERAVEYLISGIPETNEEFNPSTNLSRRGSTAAAALAAANIEPGPEQHDSIEASSIRDDPFEFLRNQPQFLQMRSLVYQNPDLLHAVLQQIGQTNPALLQLISENQDAFLNMLNQPIDGQTTNDNNTQDHSGRRAQLANAARSIASGLNITSPSTATTADANSERSPAGNSDSSARNRSGGQGIITLSEQDQEAIERLKALGFPEALVLQAYFACDKDEQLAANFLISSAFDD